MAPAKRKASSRSSARLSNKRAKMITTKSDAELEMKPEATTKRAPRVQLPHACKEMLEELKRDLDFKSVGSTVDFLLPAPKGAKAIAELTKDLGFNSGAQTINRLLEMVRTKQPVDFQNTGRQLGWLFPTQTRRLKELTRELGFDRGGQTVDWILPMASKDLLKLTRLLGFQDSVNTVQWLLHQAKPAIAARIGIQDTQAHIHHPASVDNITGYTSTYSSHPAPPFPAPPFSKNLQEVTPSTFTPTEGLGSCSPTRYSSSPYTPTPTLVQSSTESVTAHHSNLPIPNTYFNGFHGNTGGQSQMKRDGQLQRGHMSSDSMFNSTKMNMQAFPHPQSQISTWQGKWQQAPKSFQLHRKGQAEDKPTHQEDENPTQQCGKPVNEFLSIIETKQRISRRLRSLRMLKLKLHENVEIETPEKQQDEKLG